jgi:hypothetical protein
MAIILRTHKLPRSAQDIVHNVYGQLQRELEAYGKDVKLDFDATVVTWKHKPTFKVDVLVLPDIVSCKVWTEDQIYQWVDEGTKGPYPIPKIPSKTKGLAFMVGGEPKTRPNVDTAGPGRPGNKLVVLPVGMQVQHPGIEPRNFTKNIRKWHSKDFYKRIDKAIARWAKELNQPN